MNVAEGKKKKKANAKRRIQTHTNSNKIKSFISFKNRKKRDLDEQFAF